MQQFRQLLRTQRECILHRYASADVPCCAYRVPLAASGLLYSSCGRNRRYPHRCRSRHRNSTMKPSHCRSRIRSPPRPGRAGNSPFLAPFLCDLDSDGQYFFAVAAGCLSDTKLYIYLYPNVARSYQPVEAATQIRNTLETAYTPANESGT